jgi:hypothetical protein
VRTHWIGGGGYGKAYQLLALNMRTHMGKGEGLRIRNIDFLTFISGFLFIENENICHRFLFIFTNFV